MSKPAPAIARPGEVPSRSAARALDEEICIAFGFDSPFAAHAAAAIASISGAAPRAQFRFIMLSSGLGASEQANIERAAASARFHWIDIANVTLPKFVEREHFTAAILYRLALDSLAPTDCNRIIYLDSDLIVLRDIRELWEFDLGPNPIAAVPDCEVDAEQFGSQWRLLGDAPRYFNSGVLLMDLKACRAEGALAAAANIIQEHNASLRFADQDALNCVFWNRWCVLPASWNVQRLSVLKAAAHGTQDAGALLGAAAIVHFTGSHKPWLSGSYHPWAWLYWKNLAKTPYAVEVRRASGITTKEFYRIRLRWFRSQLQQAFVKLSTK